MNICSKQWVAVQMPDAGQQQEAAARGRANGNGLSARNRGGAMRPGSARARITGAALSIFLCCSCRWQHRLPSLLHTGGTPPANSTVCC